MVDTFGQSSPAKPTLVDMDPKSKTSAPTSSAEKNHNDDCNDEGGDHNYKGDDCNGEGDYTDYDACYGEDDDFYGEDHSDVK